MPIPIVTAGEMRAIEERAATLGATSPVLMENAGAAVARTILRECAPGRVLVLVGPGNNGGDGLVAARYLHDAGVATAIYSWKRDLDRPDANLALVKSRAIPIVEASTDPDRHMLASQFDMLQAGDVVLDALLGTGQSRPVEPDLASILDFVNNMHATFDLPTLIVALDLPTGLNAGTGEADPHTLHADRTITLGCPKVGLYLFPGAAAVGQVDVVDIGIPPGVAGGGTLLLITADDVRERLPERPLNSNKGTFGKALIVAGSLNYTGAPYLSATAAGRSGAGLVTLAIARTIYAILASRIAEATFQPLPDEDGALSEAALEPLQKQMQSYTATLIGPGLGRHASTERLVRAAVRAAPNALVVDADGLNALAEPLQSRPHSEIFAGEGTAILTPHPGELGRLLGSDAKAVEADRLGAIRQAVERTGQVVVLKGAHTLVAAPGSPVWLNPIANPALATAGSGDVLAGLITGLLAQGLSRLDAAICGVFIHSVAGLLASAEYGDAGVLAGDLLPLIPKAIKQTSSTT